MWRSAEQTILLHEMIQFHAIIDEKIKNQTIWLIFNFNCNLRQQVPETTKSKQNLR